MFGELAGAAPGRGRVDIKYRRLPSGLIAGSRSAQPSPENETASAACHPLLPSTARMICVDRGEVVERVKCTSRSSGLKVVVNSWPVETIPC